MIAFLTVAVYLLLVALIGGVILAVLNDSGVIDFFTPDMNDVNWLPLCRWVKRQLINPRTPVIITGIGILSTITVVLFRFHFSTQWDTVVMNRIVRAARTNESEEAAKLLDVPIQWMEDRGLTEGSSDLFYPGNPKSDIGEWYTNLKEAREATASMENSYRIYKIPFRREEETCMSIPGWTDKLEQMGAIRLHPRWNTEHEGHAKPSCESGNYPDGIYLVPAGKKLTIALWSGIVAWVVGLLWMIVAMKISNGAISQEAATNDVQPPQQIPNDGLESLRKETVAEMDRKAFQWSNIAGWDRLDNSIEGIRELMINIRGELHKLRGESKLDQKDFESVMNGFDDAKVELEATWLFINDGWMKKAEKVENTLVRTYLEQAIDGKTNKF